MTEQLWEKVLVRYIAKGTATERQMATLLIDLLELPSARPIFDGAALRMLEAA